MAKSTPTYLMRKPGFQVPFEAIYRPGLLNKLAKEKAYMVDDFFDQNRGTFVTGNLATDPNSWTYPTSSVTITITHSGASAMLKHDQLPAGNVDGAGDTGQKVEVYWYLHENNAALTDYTNMHWYFKGGLLYKDGTDASNPPGAGPRRIVFTPRADDTSDADMESKLITGDTNVLGAGLQHAYSASHYFKVGTSSLEFANNLVARINDTGSYFPFTTSSTDANGFVTYGTKNIQLLTASVITSGSAVKVKIHTTAPLCAPHTTKLKIPSTVATLHPTSTYGLPVNAAGDSAELLQNAAGFYETHLYFKSSGKDKINTFLQAGEPPGEKTLFPKANVATKVAEHEFRPHVQLKDIPEYAASTELRVYAASINNFLAETINFFIEPDGEVGKYYDYKMPIMASSVQT